MSNSRAVSTAALEVATAKWAREDDPASVRAVCLGVPEGAKVLWSSQEADAKTAAKAFCEMCPRRRQCLEWALDSKALGSIYAGFNFESAAERRLGAEWLGRVKPRVDRRRKPNNRELVAS